MQIKNSNFINYESKPKPAGFSHLVYVHLVWPHWQKLQPERPRS